MSPYRGRPDYTFWRRGIGRVAPDQVDPVVRAPFRLTEMHRVATAGSCFAQHIARRLAGRGFHYLVTESEPASESATDENYGVFSARYGNVYTTLQLQQLFDRAYGLFSPADDVWVRADGAVVDPFRPRIQEVGFPTHSALNADKVVHLSAVRRVFEECDIFVFTLGLTECWISRADNAAVPLAPGVEEGCGVIENYRFENLGVLDMVEQLNDFLRKLKLVNPTARTILTVSPVPLVATYEDRHVLTSTLYSKSALRVVAEIVSSANPQVAYFPSYEIITGPHSKGAYFENDLREVTSIGIDRVMSLFFRHYVDAEDTGSKYAQLAPTDPKVTISIDSALREREFLRELGNIVCDEEVIDSE